MWLQKWLGNTYLYGWAKLHSTPFTVNELASILRIKVDRARVALSHLKKNYAVIEFDKTGKKVVYRFVDPEVFFLINSGSLMSFDRAFKKTFHLIFKVASKLWFTQWVSGLITYSPINNKFYGVRKVEFLVLCEEKFNKKMIERLSHLIKLEKCLQHEIEFLAKKGVWIKVGWLPITLKDVEKLPEKTLRAVKDGLILFDRIGEAFKALTLIRAKLIKTSVDG